MKYLFVFLVSALTVLWFWSCSDRAQDTKPTPDFSKDGSVDGDKDDSEEDVSDGQDDLADGADDSSLDGLPRVVLAWEAPDDPVIHQYNIYRHSSASAAGELWKKIDRDTPGFNPQAPKLAIDPEEVESLPNSEDGRACFSIVATRYGEESDATEIKCVTLPK